MRPKLSASQTSLLTRLGIPISQVLDARGISVDSAKRLMRASGQTVAIRDYICKRNHAEALWTPKHCILCHPQNLRFRKAFTQTATIYIARSSSLRLTKVGISTQVHVRIKYMNTQRYAGASDWKLHYERVAHTSGRHELNIHKALAKHVQPVLFLRAGKVRTSRETFSCSVAKARSLIEAL